MGEPRAAPRRVAPVRRRPSSAPRVEARRDVPEMRGLCARAAFESVGRPVRRLALQFLGSSRVTVCGARPRRHAARGGAPAARRRCRRRGDARAGRCQVEDELVMVTHTRVHAGVMARVVFVPKRFYCTETIDLPTRKLAPVPRPGVSDTVRRRRRETRGFLALREQRAGARATSGSRTDLEPKLLHYSS